MARNSMLISLSVCSARYSMSLGLLDMLWVCEITYSVLSVYACFEVGEYSVVSLYLGVEQHLHSVYQTFLMNKNCINCV